MEEFLQFFQNYGFSGLISGVLFIWVYFLQKQLNIVNCKFHEYQQTINTKIIEIVEANTKAMVELKDSIKEIRKI